MGGAALLNWQPHSPRAPPLAGSSAVVGAVLFWSLRTDGTLNKGSLHSIWVCQPLSAHSCEDCIPPRSTHLPHRPGPGPCTAQEVGTAGNPGSCLLSCNRCDLMPQRGGVLGSRKLGLGAA